MIQTASAPGRAELLGNHTDYNQGLVLSIAVDRTTTVTGRLRDDGRILLRATDLDQTAECAVDTVAPVPGADWASYPLGVIDQLQKRGIGRGQGVELEISSTLPMGAGLSSSAALEVSTALCLQKLWAFNMDRLEIAKLCQAAENQFVGVNCGLLDQISSLFGLRDHAVFIDCRTLKVETIPLGSNARFVIAHSHVKHELVAGEYNERRASCEEAASLLGVPALRDASWDLLNARIPDKASKPYRRAAHIIGENDRVSRGVELLRKGDLAGFGALMCESHQSSVDHFENSCPELDMLVDIARTIEGCHGARLSGGGFGGATINLVEKDALVDFQDGLAMVYDAKGGGELTLIEAEAWNGAS